MPFCGTSDKRPHWLDRSARTGIGPSICPNLGCFRLQNISLVGEHIITSKPEIGGAELFLSRAGNP